MNEGRALRDALGRDGYRVLRKMGLRAVRQRLVAGADAAQDKQGGLLGKPDKVDGGLDGLEVDVAGAAGNKDEIGGFASG